MRIALVTAEFYHRWFYGECPRKMKSLHRAGQTTISRPHRFPELAICAYPPRDFLEFEDFISKTNQSTLEPAASCIGIPQPSLCAKCKSKKEGKISLTPLYVLRDEKIIDTWFIEALLPKLRHLWRVQILWTQSSVSLCRNKRNENRSDHLRRFVERRWWSDVHSFTDGRFDSGTTTVNDQHCRFAVWLWYAKAEKIFYWNVRKYSLPLVYVNHTGAQTEIIFWWWFVRHFDSQGNTTCELNYFRKIFG